MRTVLLAGGGLLVAIIIVGILDSAGVIKIEEPIPEPTVVEERPTATPTRIEQIRKDCGLEIDTRIEKREDSMGAIYVVTLGDRCVALDTRACKPMGEVSCVR